MEYPRARRLALRARSCALHDRDQAGADLVDDDRAVPVAAFAFPVAVVPAADPFSMATVRPGWARLANEARR
jgi:hypothetical protein